MSKCGEEKAPEAPKASCDIPTATFTCPADDCGKKPEPKCEEPPKPACELEPKCEEPKPVCEPPKPACGANGNNGGKGKDDGAPKGNDNSCEVRPLSMDK